MCSLKQFFFKQNRIVRFLDDLDDYSGVVNVNISRGINEAPEEDFGLCLFKAWEVFCQQLIEGVGRDGHREIQINLDHDRGREQVQMKKVNLFANGFFHQPPSGIFGRPPAKL